MIVKILDIFFSIIVTTVLSLTFDNEFQSNCKVDVKFDYDKDGSNLPIVSCFSICTNDAQKVEQASISRRFYYHDKDVEKKYGRMVEITVSQDGSLKCVLVPTNAIKTEDVQNAAEETYLIPEKLVSKSEATCPKRYEYVQEIETCFKISDNKLTWKEAVDACVADGGTLVIVDTEEKHNALSLAAESIFRKTSSKKKFEKQKDLWIGLSDIKTEGKFEWVDGSPLIYSRWSSIRELSNREDKKDCVHISFVNQPLWNDLSCDRQFRYMCEVRPIHHVEETLPVSYYSSLQSASTSVSANSGMIVIDFCPTGWWKSSVTETCYYVGEDGRTYNRSIQFCESIGGTIASIHSPSEMAFIQDLKKKTGAFALWIGLNDRLSEGRYEWVDGTLLNYTSWADSQPDDAYNNEECVAIDQNWQNLWNDLSCDHIVRQLCQRKSEKLAIKVCSFGSLVVKHVEEDFYLDDLICPTQSAPSLVCVQKDGSVETMVDNQYLAPLVIISALLVLHFFGFVLVSLYFCKFYMKSIKHDSFAKTDKNHSGNRKKVEISLAHYSPPKIMKVPPVPAPLAVRKGGQDRNNVERNTYDVPVYDTEKYGSYINPRVK